MQFVNRKTDTKYWQTNSKTPASKRRNVALVHSWCSLCKEQFCISCIISFFYIWARSGSYADVTFAIPSYDLPGLNVRISDRSHSRHILDKESGIIDSKSEQTLASIGKWRETVLQEWREILRDPKILCDIHEESYISAESENWLDQCCVFWLLCLPYSCAFIIGRLSMLPYGSRQIYDIRAKHFLIAFPAILLWRIGISKSSCDFVNLYHCDLYNCGCLNLYMQEIQIQIIFDASLFSTISSLQIVMRKCTF